jgi:hypothetical protein
MENPVYIYIELRIRLGEYEFNSKTAHCIELKNIRARGIKGFVDDFASGFYGGTPNKQDDTYYFNGGEVAVSVKRYREMTSVDYYQLKEYI